MPSREQGLVKGQIALEVPVNGPLGGTTSVLEFPRRGHWREPVFPELLFALGAPAGHIFPEFKFALGALGGHIFPEFKFARGPPGRGGWGRIAADTLKFQGLEDRIFPEFKLALGALGGHIFPEFKFALGALGGQIFPEFKFAPGSAPQGLGGSTPSEVGGFHRWRTPGATRGLRGSWASVA